MAWSPLRTNPFTKTPHHATHKALHGASSFYSPFLFFLLLLFKPFFNCFFPRNPSATWRAAKCLLPGSRRMLFLVYKRKCIIASWRVMKWSSQVSIISACLLLGSWLRNNWICIALMSASGVLVTECLLSSINLFLFWKKWIFYFVLGEGWLIEMEKLQLLIYLKYKKELISPQCLKWHFSCNLSLDHWNLKTRTENFLLTQTFKDFWNIC